MVTTTPHCHIFRLQKRTPNLVVWWVWNHHTSITTVTIIVPYINEKKNHPSYSFYSTNFNLPVRLLFLSHDWFSYAGRTIYYPVTSFGLWEGSSREFNVLPLKVLPLCLHVYIGPVSQIPTILYSKPLSIPSIKQIFWSPLGNCWGPRKARGRRWSNCLLILLQIPC